MHAVADAEISAVSEFFVVRKTTVPSNAENIKEGRRIRFIIFGLSYDALVLSAKSFGMPL